MAPMLIDPPPSSPASRRSTICSDALVVPSDKASKRTKELWWLHGHPHSKRYADPKLVSLAALVRHDGVAYKGQKAFLYPVSSESSTPYKSMTWNEFDSVTETIALSYAYQLQNELRQANQTQGQPTVALLGGGRTLEYFCTQLALQKLGLRVLLLAESNTQNALHFLLDSCGVLVVITDSKNARVDTNGIRKLNMIERIPSGTHSGYTDVDTVKFQEFGDVWERHTFIIHSSGSTGMPKPIVHTNRSMMLIARMYRLFQEFSIENWYLLFPLYHIAGISIALSGLPNGQMLSFPPLFWPPSASSIFTAWRTLSKMGYPVECVHCAPTLIENMYDYIMENERDFSPLASLKLLQPGGAVLAKHIIKELTDHGVNVKTTYGSTEIGPPFRSVPHTRENPNCYSFRNLYPDSPFLKMEPVGEDFYECVVYKGFDLAAELWEGEASNQAYRTNDLFIQDPPGSGFYVMQGRKDDILVHTNGENTNAGSLQLDIQASSKVISRALALGHSQPCVSLLVQVHEQFDPTSASTKERVWQTVKKANARYPAHSQIMRSMILMLPRDCTLPVTPKGNVKRKEAERLYARQIRQLYSIDVIPSKASLSQEPLSNFLRRLFARVANVRISEINDWTTLYDLGVDSRLALTIRSALATRLNTSISLSVIFENPSVSQLLSYLEPKSASPEPVQPTLPSMQIIERIISRLEFEFRTWAPRLIMTTYPIAPGETVLLTGSTGSLGTALLETLASSPRITKIYAMVRGPTHLARLRQALENKGLDPSILDGDKIRVLNFSMQDPLLGLDIDTYHRLAASVTMVVQTAWKMDFNMGVEEFEGDCIRSTMSLLRFCYAGRPKTMAFTSSISTCMGAGQNSPIVHEEPIGLDPTVALPTGYAQSKYIIERILQTASQPTRLNIPIHLLRVGQLTGSSRTGHWNIDEMFPIIFATSAHHSMRALPVFPSEKRVDWIPVDIAASTIGEIILSQASQGKHSGETNRENEKKYKQQEEAIYEVHNIVNPHSILWEQLLAMLQSSTLSSQTATQKLELIPLKTWVSRLTALAERGTDTKDVPGLRLLGFFEDMVPSSSSGEETKIFETAKSEKLSEALRGCEAVNGEWVERWIGRWREGGFIS